MDWAKNVKQTISKILFILGVRRAYEVELKITLVACIVFLVLKLFIGITCLTAISVVLILLLIPIYQLLKSKGERKEGKWYDFLTQKIRIPLFAFIVALIVCFYYPPSAPLPLLFALFLEDITIMSHTEIITLKRNSKIIVEPFKRRESLLTLSLPMILSLVAYFITESPLVFLYPMFAYLLIIYSIIYVPPDLRSEIGYKKSIFERIAINIPILYFLYRRFYTKRDIRLLGKEAGMVGATYYRLINQWASIFTVVTYFTVSLSPVFYAVLGVISGVVIGGVTLGVFFAPLLILKLKRSSRVSKIQRNITLILTYLASMFSVAETFTSAMENVYYNKNLGKIFGLDEEASIYLNIYKTKQAETLALEEYADSIPQEFYRDTVRTIRDVAENEGFGAVFRTLIVRLREFTAKHIENVRTTFESVGGNVISIILLSQTTLPLLLALSYPQYLPWAILLTGGISVVLNYMVTSMVMPDLPSEFIFAKQRYKFASIVFLLTATVLALIEKILLPDILKPLLILNIPVSLSVALYYASYEDLKINEEFLEKFPDLLVLFSSSMTRHNSVERAMLELSQQQTFSPRLRRLFRRLSTLFSTINVERLVYKGQYWYKFFLFLATISARYGSVPRELYKAISEFMFEYKKFFSLLKSFTNSLLFMNIIALLVLNIETHIVLVFIKMSSKMNLQKLSQVFGVSTPLPSLPPAQAHHIQVMTTIMIFVTAILNGIILGKISSGTIRNGKYTLLLYLLQMLIAFIGKVTSFGIKPT